MATTPISARLRNPLRALAVAALAAGVVVLFAALAFALPPPNPTNTIPPTTPTTQCHTIRCQTIHTVPNGGLDPGTNPPATTTTTPGTTTTTKATSNGNGNGSGNGGGETGPADDASRTPRRRPR